MLCNFETIKHQTQPCKDSCLMTCVAMAMGVDAGVFMDELHDESEISAPVPIRDLIPSLVRRNIYAEKLDGVMRYPLIDNCPLIITTLSKTNIGILHAVLVYYNEYGDFILLDPAEGRYGVETYSSYDWMDNKVPICEMIALYDCSI